MPPTLLLLATAINLASAVFSAIICYVAYRAFRFLGSIKMLFLSLSFLMFSLALFSQTFYAVAAILGDQTLSRLFLGEGYLLYTILMFAGYVVLAFAYRVGEATVASPLVLLARSSPTNSALRHFSGLRMLFEYAVQALSVALLLYVLVKVYQEYFSRKASYALPIAMGLTLLLIQLLVRTFYLDSSLDYMFAAILQLGGFSLIFYAVWKVSSK